jgi:TfoX/Sxy family transcriptional regulator of competence genes
MDMPKPSDATKESFAALFDDVAGVEVKPMFGNLGAFVNGNMFAGLFGETLGIKLIEQGSRDELSAVEGTGPFGPEERPMGGYLALPVGWETAPDHTRAWIMRSLAEVSMLPPKKPKAKASKVTAK